MLNGCSVHFCRQCALHKPFIQRADHSEDQSIILSSVCAAYAFCSEGRSFRGPIFHFVVSVRCIRLLFRGQIIQRPIFHFVVSVQSIRLSFRGQIIQRTDRSFCCQRALHTPFVQRADHSETNPSFCRQCALHTPFVQRAGHSEDTERGCFRSLLIPKPASIVCYMKKGERSTQCLRKPSRNVNCTNSIRIYINPNPHPHPHSNHPTAMPTATCTRNPHPRPHPHSTPDSITHTRTHSHTHLHTPTTPQTRQQQHAHAYPHSTPILTPTCMTATLNRAHWCQAFDQDEDVAVATRNAVRMLEMMGSPASKRCMC